VSIVERAAGRLGGVSAALANSKRAPTHYLRDGDDVRRDRGLVEHIAGMSRAHVAEPLATTGRAGTDEDAANADEQPRLQIDARWMRRQNFITPEGGRTMIAEDFRCIKRHLLAGALKPRIMVTSALPGEGKTFCAINLAVSLAMDLDRSVVLVDADTVRPSVLQNLGVEDGMRGLMDVLVEGGTFGEDLVRRTNIGKLSIVPSGTHRENATELLASDKMRALVQDLSDRRRDQIVIFDSPPLLVASESAALAGHMSQILMVVAAKQTTEVALKEALKRLDGCNCPVGLVLNKSDSSGVGYGYYGYGQG
jgi:protein-tyrosine kinase